MACGIGRYDGQDAKCQPSSRFNSWRLLAHRNGANEYLLYAEYNPLSPEVRPGKRNLYYITRSVF
jgi:hypothetical protein